LYGPGYNDHDTFYITAASATSGGSSGSPVIDASGRCIALNAGGATQASTSFFLPLDRVPRALEYVRNIVARKEHQSSKSLSRGTLQVVFKHRSLDDVRRLGLPQQEESDIRAANSAVTGMLIIGKTVPGGNGANAGLKEGDIVLRINQQTVLDFVHLEDILDRAVEEQKDVEMEVQRGAEKLRVSVKAQSLWELIPDEYVEYSRGIFHPLSLNLALGANTPPNSIFVATPGYSLQRCGITSGSLIRQIGDWSIHTLDDLERAICAFPDGTKVPIRFSHMSAPHVEELRVMIIDRKWFPMVRRKRVLTSSGEEWTLKPSPEAPSSSFSEQDPESSTLRRAAPAPSLRRDIEHMDRVSARVMKSMVSVTFNVPFEVDGQQGNDYFGCGVVLDKSRGLILCDRNTVTCLAGDVKVSVASSVELAARPLFLHPTLNVAIVQVNPKLLEQCDVDDLPLFNDKHVPDVRGGDELNFYGLSYQQHIKMIPSVRATSVERANTRTPSVPRFSAKNFDVVHFDQTPSGTVGGVFVDPEGVCRALWSSFYIQERNENVEVFYSTLIGPVRDALKQVQESLDQNRPVEPIYQLGVEFNRMDFAEARSGFGLSDEWIDKISRAADSNLSGAAKGTREVFVIERIMAGSKALGQVMVGDILLACDGHPVVSYYEVDALSRKYGRENKPLPLTVLRNGKVLQLEAKLTPLSPIGTDKVLFFAGLQVQPTHDAVLFHGFCPEHLTNERRGCFISGVAFGSPANSAGIFAVRWIVEANETKVDSLQSLVDVVKHVKHNDCVRLRLQDLQGNTQVVTVRIDHNFWQTSMLAYDNADGQWKTMTM